MANGILGADNELETTEVIGSYQMEDKRELKTQSEVNPTTTNATSSQTDHAEFLANYYPTRKDKLALLHSLLNYFSAGLTDIEMAIPALEDTRRTAGFYVPAEIRYKERHTPEFLEGLRHRSQSHARSK